MYARIKYTLNRKELVKGGKSIMRARFKYKAMLINDDWTGERLYELQVKFMGLNMGNS